MSTPIQIDAISRLFTYDVVRNLMLENKKIVSDLLNADFNNRVVFLVYKSYDVLYKKLNGDSVREEHPYVDVTSLKRAQELLPHTNCINNCDPKKQFCFVIASSVSNKTIQAYAQICLALL